MATPDLEVIKDIPGYKVILKAILKSQIQQLVRKYYNLMATLFIVAFSISLESLTFKGNIQ